MFLVTVNENDLDSSDHVPLSEYKKIYRRSNSDTKDTKQNGE
jgi:hypothetical protein